MSEQFSRTELLLGQKAMRVLAASRVAVFGVGGVGGYAVEALARSGVGTLDIVDSDTVALSNLNRQIIATHSTVGRYKVDVMRERILDINPNAAVYAHRCFYLPETRDMFDFTEYDYVVDAVDTVTAKIQLVLEAQRAGTPVISSMGAGNKLDPAAFEVADIYETSVCPLAKVMRRELKKRGVERLKVVYSREEPVRPAQESAAEEMVHAGAQNRCSGETADMGAQNRCSGETADMGAQNRCSDETTDTGAHAPRRSTPGSVSFVPSVAGLILAGEVIKDLIKMERH